MKDILLDNIFCLLRSIKGPYTYILQHVCYQGYQEEEDLHYAALSINQHNRSKRQRDDTNNECVYASVKQ